MSDRAPPRRRIEKRRASRARQSTRRDLVHAAGCTEPYCASRWFFDADLVREVLSGDDLRGRPIRVPRSLRHLLGASVSSSSDRHDATSAVTATIRHPLRA